MKVVIIGGVAGGATAAARLRRLDERAEIIILERTGYVSYANCGLPYYVGGVITDREELTLQTPEGFRNRFGIDVRVGQEAVELRPEQHTVTVRRLEDGSTYALHYDKLILSPGARPVRPNLPGEDDPRVFTLRTVEDTLRIRAYLDEHPVRRAVVVGGGFIGLEMAENLVHAGVHTTLLQRGAQVLPPLDADMAAEIHAYLRGQGVELRLGVRVSGFSPQGDGLAVELEGGERFPADLVLLGIGVPPTRSWPAGRAWPWASRGRSRWTGRCAPAPRTSTPWVTRWRCGILSPEPKATLRWPARPTSRGALPPTTSAGGGAPTLGRWAPRCSSSLT